MSIGTMFSLFNVGQSTLKANATEAESFARNMQMAEAAQAQLYKKQARTPAGFTQLLEMTQQAVPGLAQATNDVNRMTELMTELSLLGPALNNDFAQMGRDVQRILGGGAEQEVLTWRLIRGEVFKLVKDQELLGKNIENNDQFMLKFNKTLDAGTKLGLLEQVMGRLGDDFKNMFAQSLSGLLGATKSKASQLAGAFTAPMTLGFRTFMRRANMGEIIGQKIGKDGKMKNVWSKGGLLQKDSMDKLIGIMAYFGDIVGGKLTKFLYGFERTVATMRDNWSKITEELKLVFQFGSVMLANAIAIQMGRMAAGQIFGLGGKAVKAQGAMGAWWKKRPGQGAESPFGKLSQGAANLRYVFGTVLNPAMWALAAVAATVGVMVAGMAAYILGNWKKLIRQILDGWDGISKALTTAYISGLKLYNALQIIGSVFLENGGAVDALTGSLNVLDTIIWGISKAITYVTYAMEGLNKFIAFFQMVVAGILGMYGTAASKIGLTTIGENLKMLSKDFETAGKENIDDGLRWARARAQLQVEMERAAKDRELGKAKALEDRLKGGLKGLLQGGKKKTPGSGVHITNQYNQWDLRNTDPDRIMSAFVPKLEQMADQRTQSYEALDQGV